MEKESLIDSFESIDTAFKTFFDFNIIFSPSGDGKVVLNYKHIKEVQIKIANKISFLKSQIDPKNSDNLIIIDLTELIGTLEDETFKQTNSDQILQFLNQIALKYKKFIDIQKLILG